MCCNVCLYRFPMWLYYSFVYNIILQNLILHVITHFCLARLYRKSALLVDEVSLISQVIISNTPKQFSTN